MEEIALQTLIRSEVKTKPYTAEEILFNIKNKYPSELGVTIERTKAILEQLYNDKEIKKHDIFFYI